MAGGQVTQTLRPSAQFDATRWNASIAPHFEDFMTNELFFAPQDSHRVIEIEEGADGKCKVTESVLREQDISPWLHKSSGDNPNPRIKVRMLHLAPRGDYRSMVPLPLSSSTFREMFAVFKIPRVFLRVLLSNLPVALRFTPDASVGVSGAVALMLRTDAFSFGQYCTYQIFDPTIQCTTAVCLGLRTTEYEELIQCIPKIMHSPITCMTLPMLLVDFMNGKTAQWLTDKRLRLQAISKSKEINVRELADDHGFREDEDIDLDTATRRLTRLSGEYGIVESIVKTQMRFLDCIEAILLERLQILANDSTSPKDVDATELLLHEMMIFRESFKSALQYVDRDKHAIQTLTQTTYCLIAQKESQRNLMIAESSRAISEWMQKDSTDMRIITAITLIFLPATFTAALLGSNLFNFNPSKGERIAAQYSWIYWVATVALTAVVLLAWVLVTKAKTQIQAKTLHVGHEMAVLNHFKQHHVATPGCRRPVSSRSMCESGCGGCGSCGT